MKVEFLRSGKIYTDCRTWFDQKKGDVRDDIPAEHCKKLISMGRVKEYVEPCEDSKVAEDDKQKYTRSELEDIYKDLGGRARDSWSDEKLRSKIAEKQA